MLNVIPLQLMDYANTVIFSENNSIVCFKKRIISCWVMSYLWTTAKLCSY